MANYIYYLLEQKIISLNQSEYIPLKDFLQHQINDCDKKLSLARENLRTFQISNKAYNVPAQLELTMKAVAANKAELLSLDNELSFQRSLHPDGFSGISIINQRRTMLEKKLEDMERSQKVDLLPGLDQSINLAYSFADLYKEVETYSQLEIILRQQFEQAKIRESKNFAPLYLVDSARPAEYKFKPKRAVVILVIVGLYMSLLLIFILFRDHYRRMLKEDPDYFKHFSELINGK
jgi:capsule polysaccharide export protein KpsE/RkpR